MKDIMKQQETFDLGLNPLVVRRKKTDTLDCGCSEDGLCDPCGCWDEDDPQENLINENPDYELQAYQESQATDSIETFGEYQKKMREMETELSFFIEKESQ